MEVLYLTITALYVLLLLVFIITWRGIKIQIINDTPATYITIVIAARNEEVTITNLLQDLLNQKYDKSLFEIIVVDDHSEDSTAERVRNFIVDNDFQVKLINPNLYKNLSGKKAAIQSGIECAKGTVIVTIDADCSIVPEYLKTVESFYRSNNLKMITGPVAFFDKGSLFSKMQQIEFSSLIGSGAVTLELGFPSMCNGANLIYEKQAFFEVKGFEGNEDIASGDDEFLMHKMHKAYPGKVKFLKSRQATVFTSSCSSLKNFYNQRRRWSSKWSYYKSWTPKVLAAFIFGYNFTLLITFLFVSTRQVPGLIFLLPLILKIGLEFLFLKNVVEFSSGKIKILPFLLLEIIYPFYVSFFAFLSKSGKYSWKGRNLK